MIQEWSDLSGRILDNGCGLGSYLNAFAPFSQQRFGLEIEEDRARQALAAAEGIVTSQGEMLPFASNSFDVVFSNEVIEHVGDDGASMSEMIRVVKPAGRVLIFCPNRWYPVEQHGIYWRGSYKFGNIPFVNYLPDPLRDRLAPHVRTYTWRKLKSLWAGQPVRVVHHTVIFGGYDNIERRFPAAGRLLKGTLYTLEKTPLRFLGISHWVVL